jgi:hypothetical protein
MVLLIIIVSTMKVPSHWVSTFTNLLPFLSLPPSLSLSFLIEYVGETDEDSALLHTYLLFFFMYLIPKGLEGLWLHNRESVLCKSPF